MRLGLKIILYLFLVYFLITAILSILSGTPKTELILPVVLYVLTLFVYPRIFDKFYEKGGAQSLLFSSIEMATIGAIIGSFDVSIGPISLLFGALGALLVIQAHEIGHFIFAKKYGLYPVSLPIRKVFKVGFGITLAAVVHKRAKRWKEHAVVALAGPLMNLLLMGVFWILLQVVFDPYLALFFDLMYLFNRYFFIVNILFEGVPLLLSFLAKKY